MRIFGVLILVGIVGCATVGQTDGAKCPKRQSVVVGIVDVCPTNGNSSVSSVYVQALALAGHTPFVLPRVADSATLAEQIRHVDLVLFCGGADIEPWRYGMEKSPRCEENNPGRDAFDWRVLDECVRVRKPVFGICRGVQLINCYFGGTLYQDIYSEIPGVMRHRFTPGEKKDYITHDVTVLEGSRLASVLGAGSVRACSWHHQAVCRLAPGFRIAACAPDGIVEAIESDTYPVAGVQFHPEQNVKKEPDSQLLAIFCNVMEICGVAKVAVK